MIRTVEHVGEGGPLVYAGKTIDFVPPWPAAPHLVRAWGIVVGDRFVGRMTPPPSTRRTADR